MDARYTVLRRLGTGAAGVVNLVKRKQDRRLFAAKEIEGIGTNEESARAGENSALSGIPEIASMNLPSHPSIVTLEETIRTRTGIILILEYVPGGTVQDYVANSAAPIEESTVARWLNQACGALHLIHERGIIHRDLKLANLLLASEGACIKIGDFGVATCTLHQGKEKMAVSSVGTPFYMSPEICEGLPYSNKADVWSLGVCFYEICARRVPFEGQNLLAVARAITCDPFDPLPRASYSEGFCGIIERMLAKDPSDRPSIFDVQLQLKQYFRNRNNANPPDSLGNTMGTLRRPQEDIPLPPSPQFSDVLDGSEESGTPMRNVTNLPLGKRQRSGTPVEASPLTNDDRRKIFEENRAIAARNRQRLRQTESPNQGAESPREGEARKDDSDGMALVQEPPSVGNRGYDYENQPERECSHVQSPAVPPIQGAPFPFSSNTAAAEGVPPHPETEGLSLAEELRREVSGEVAMNLKRINELFPPTPREPVSVSSQPTATPAAPDSSRSRRSNNSPLPIHYDYLYGDANAFKEEVEAVRRSSEGVLPPPVPMPTQSVAPGRGPTVIASDESSPKGETLVTLKPAETNVQEVEEEEENLPLPPRGQAPLPHGEKELLYSPRESEEKEEEKVRPVRSPSPPKPGTSPVVSTEAAPQRSPPLKAAAETAIVEKEHSAQEQEDIDTPALPTTTEMVRSRSPSPPDQTAATPPAPPSSARDPLTAARLTKPAAEPKGNVSILSEEELSGTARERVSKAPLCKNCSPGTQEKRREADWYCSDCEATLCEQCCNSIHGISLFQTHTLFRLHHRSEAEQKEEGKQEQKPVQQEAAGADEEEDEEVKQRKPSSKTSEEPTAVPQRKEDASCCCVVS